MFAADGSTSEQLAVTEAKDVQPAAIPTRLRPDRLCVPVFASKSRVTAHNLLVIWLTATRRAAKLCAPVKPPADLLRLFSGSAVIVP